MLNGPPGVGKSRLAREALARAASEGWSVLEIRASAGMVGVPLAPLRRVLRIPPSADLAELAESVERALVAARSERGLIVLADDAHALDAASAGLLHQLVAAGSIIVMVTTRAGAQPPAAVTDLWKDGLAERIELQQLSRRETAELLDRVLGGPLEESSADRLWRVTNGNPLYVREVVLASAESGALRRVDGQWRWRGEWAGGARLREIVSGRLSGLDPDELSVLEMLALGGTLPPDLVAGVATLAALESLEQRGLVRIEHHGRRTVVAIAHPMHAEVLKSRMTALQQRATRRNLVDALAKTGCRRNEDRLRRACWSLESNLEVDPVTLTLGADASLFQIGHSIASRLTEILTGDSDVEQRPAGYSPPAGPALGVRLARAAYERHQGVHEGAVLATALAWSGAADEAEVLLTELVGWAEAPNDRVRIALGLGWIRFWCRFDVDAARAALREGIEIADADTPPELLADAYQQLAGIELNTGRPRHALEYAAEVARVLGLKLSATSGSPPASASLSYLGRCIEALEMVDEAIAVNGGAGAHPLTVPTLVFTRAGTLARMGRLDEAEALAQTCRDVALSSESHEGAALFGILLGEVMLRQGRPLSAARVLRDAAGLLAERDPLGYRPWALTALARARAQTGDVTGAVECLAEARQIQPISRHFEISRFLGEYEVAAASGSSDKAVQWATEGAEWARGCGMVIEEAMALDAAVRLAPQPEVAARMKELATLTDSPLARLMAEHAAALIGADADSLEAASLGFARMSCWWHAAEAAAAAALVHQRRRQKRAAQAASRAAFDYASRCEGARTPFVTALTAPTGLTRREAEIATLAAAGRSSKEIATRLFLSPRTVESHLHHVYVKLGVTDRAGLAGILGDGAR